MAREAGLLVVHTLESYDMSALGSKVHSAWDPRVPDMRVGWKGPMGRFLIRGEYGNGIIDELQPQEGELVVYKPGKGAFKHTPLARILPKYGIDTLLIAGINTEVCVKETLHEANSLGFRSIVVEDCTDSHWRESHNEAITAIRASGDEGTWAAELKAVKLAIGHGTAAHHSRLARANGVVRNGHPGLERHRT